MTIENKVYKINEGVGVASPAEIKAYMKAQAPIVAEAYKEIATGKEIVSKNGLFDNKIHYKVFKKSSYAYGINALRYTGNKPFTFEQNLEARLADKALFDTELASCTAIVYGGNDKFKIITEAHELINIKPNFKGEKITCVDYDSIQIPEFDMGHVCFEGHVKYNSPLTKEEAINHPAWIAAVNGNKELLKQYADYTFSQIIQGCYGNLGKIRDKKLGFYVNEKAKKGDMYSINIAEGDDPCALAGHRPLNWKHSFIKTS